MKNHNATYCANWKELFSTEKHLETFRGRRQNAFPFVLFITLFFILSALLAASLAILMPRPAEPMLVPCNTMVAFGSVNGTNRPKKTRQPVVFFTDE